MAGALIALPWDLFVLAAWSICKSNVVHKSPSIFQSIMYFTAAKRHILCRGEHVRIRYRLVTQVPFLACRKLP